MESCLLWRNCQDWRGSDHASRASGIGTVPISTVVIARESLSLERVDGPVHTDFRVQEEE